MRQRAFTLIELLVVIAIVAILAGMLMPVLGQVQDAARKMGCQSNLRQVAMGVQLYASDHDGLLLPGYRGGFWSGFAGCWPWGQDWNWRGALEQSQVLEASYWSGVGAGIATMGCPVLRAQKPEAVLDGDWSFSRTWGFSKACYTANGVLTNVTNASYAIQPLVGTPLIKFSATSETFLAGDGVWNIPAKSWGPTGSPASSFVRPHRGQAVQAYLDGHVGSMGGAAFDRLRGEAATPGSDGHRFWRGGL